MSRRSRKPADQPAPTLSALNSTVSTSTARTKKPRLIRDLDSLSDAHLAVILTLQVNKKGEVIATRPLEFMRGRHIMRLTHVALDPLRGWILSMYDPETKETNNFERMSPTSGPLGRLREAFLDHAKVADRRHQQLA